MKIVKCSMCDNEALLLRRGSGTMVCCNKKMEDVNWNVLGTSDFHNPIVHFSECLVKIQIGDVNHPMTELHHIDMVIVITNKGFISKIPDSNAQLEIKLDSDEIVKNVYSHCNLHGWWRLIPNE